MSPSLILLIGGSGVASALPAPSHAVEGAFATTLLDMHVHACQIHVVRTTIEIPDEQRARLLEIAAGRGEKGFSGLVQEAIAQYLEREAGQAERIQAALATKGAIRGAAADQLQELASAARAGWR